MTISKRFQSYIYLTIALLALFARPAHADVQDALRFFNNWFVTGDYAVAGTGLANTGGTGSINMTGVPCTLGIGPAASIVPCATAGSVPAYPVAAFLYWENVENTATATGGKGVFNGFPIKGQLVGTDASSACWVSGNPTQKLRTYRSDVLRYFPIDTASHLRRANGSHSLSLGSAVAGNTGVLVTHGASLVVIYRVVVPGKPLIMPLRSIVIYDGAATVMNGQPNLRQVVAGFYQAAANGSPRMTHIVGNGNPEIRETLKVDGVIPAGVSADYPFTGAQGLNWDNMTHGFSLSANASSTEIKVQREAGPPSCITWATIMVSTDVPDGDGDGLLDTWETGGLHRNTQVSPATFGKCSDYPAEPCLNLPAMGALNNRKDIFLELDWMHGFGDGTGGTDGHGFHSHIPKLEALDKVANAFAAHNIALHFDVGNNYQLNRPAYILPANLGQGGEDIDEQTLVCQPGGGHPCLYSQPYPVLSFKLGFEFVKNGNHFLNIPPHFEYIRKDVFHYVLWAHALAGPFDLTGRPLSSVPKSYSGVAERPGKDVMITLGLWRSDIPINDQVGSVVVQAGTLMHEVGHNLDLSHAGWTSGPNCKPNYPSVMSYLYQTRGLTDGAGLSQIDYSNGVLAGLNEGSLVNPTNLGTLQYRIRYYAPKGPGDSVTQVAKAHCDGTDSFGAQYIRFEAPGLSAPDWSNGSVTPGTLFAQDVNFDGFGAQTFADQPDWSSLNLQQLGGYANFGSLSSGSLATDAGSLATDAGSLATDAGSLATDAGSLATDAGSLATDAGSLATDAGSLATDAGDEDYDTHILATVDGLPTPQQCAGCGLKAVNEMADVKLSWIPPETGASLSYNVYRCAGVGCTPAPPAISVGFTPASRTAPVFTDVVNEFVQAGTTCPSNKTCYNTLYTYSVTALSPLGTESPYSNTATSLVTHSFVIADNKTVVYGLSNPAPTFTVYGELAASLNSASVSCVYTGTPRNAGNYPITCTGPLTTSATNGVTYNAPYLAVLPGVLTIQKRQITVTAAASSKTYDRTTTSTSVPTITSGALQYSDSVTWTESYDNWNAGNTHVMTPAGTVSDGNSGNNYAVTYATINTGVILKAPLTITAVTNTKTYDANTSALAVPTASATVSGDSVTGLAETYDNANAGTNKTLSVSAYTVNDGNAGNNYAVTTIPNTTGVINKANAVIVVTPYSVTYDGLAHTATGTAKGVVNEDLSGLSLSGTTHTNAGTYNGDAWTFTGGTNYNNANGVVNDAIAKATPVFSNLSSPTIARRTANTALSGKLALGTIYPAGNVSITVNDSTQSAAVSASNGSFTSTFTTRTFGVGAYPITYSFAGNSNFNPASATGTLTVVD